MSDRRKDRLEAARLTSLQHTMLTNSGLPTNVSKLYGRPYLFNFGLDGHSIYRERLGGTITGLAFGNHDNMGVESTVELQISNPDALPYGRIRCLKRLRGDSNVWKIVFTDPSETRSDDQSRWHTGVLTLL
jgi:hypothetical protein